MQASDMNDDYAAIAAVYDREHSGFLEDLPLYDRYAAQSGGPILELACGSGRLTVPLARAGYTITGSDRSAAMLARCQSAAAVAGPEVAARITLRQEDMTDASEDPMRYRFAFVALGSFNHLLTLSDRRAALAALRARVVPGATLILDLAQADLRRFAILAEQGTVAHVTTLQSGADDTILTHMVAAIPGPSPASYLLTHWYDTHHQGGPVTRILAETTFSAISRAEIDLLLEATGWHPRLAFGDHDQSPWDETAPRLIVVAQAAE